MRFLLADELVAFEDSLRQHLTKNVASEVVRAHVLEDATSEADLDQDLWNAICELGMMSAAIDEAYDGLSCGFIAAEQLIRLVGEFLIPLPLSETLCFGVAPLHGQKLTEHGSALLTRIAAGEERVTGSFQSLFPGADSGVELVSNTASGTLDFCPSVPHCESILFPVVSDNGCSLHLASCSEPSIGIERFETLDVIRPYYRVTFSNTPVTTMTNEQLNPSQTAQLMSRLSILASAEMCGAMKRALHMSVEYAETRKQFGKPIGSFQAVAHKLADMHVQAEAASSLVRFAAWAVDSDSTQVEAAASAAKAYVSKVGPKVAQDALQAHGGIGFTYEYDLHLFLRRIRTLAALHGGEQFHALRLGKQDEAGLNGS